jgi:O-antigen/teichoic acid export membrane protein
MADPQGPIAAGEVPVARNALWLTAGEVASKLASFVFVVIVARALGVEQYGWFTFATALVPLVLIVGSLGLHQAVVTAVVRDPDRTSEAFASGFAVRLATGVLGVGVSAALAPLFLDDALAVATVAVVGVALMFDSMTSYVSAIFEARASTRTYAVALMINRFVSTGLALGVYLAGGGLAGVLVTYVLGSSAGAAYALRGMRRTFPFVRLRDARPATARALLRRGAPIGVAALLNMALLRFDTLMIATMLGAVAVGHYGAAFRFYESFLFLAFALGDATFPQYARHGRTAASARLLEQATVLATTAYVPLFVLSLFAGEWAVTTLFGDRYADAAPAVPWLTLAAALFAVTYQVRAAVVATGSSTPIAVVAAAALVLNIGLNLLLIPRHGITGAAVATAVAAAVEAGLTVVALRVRGIRARLVRVLRAPVAAGAGTAGLLRLAGLDGGAALLWGAAAYAVLAVAATLLLPAEHRRWVRDRAARATGLSRRG